MNTKLCVVPETGFLVGGGVKINVLVAPGEISNEEGDGDISAQVFWPP